MSATVDEQRVEQFLGQVVVDAGAALGSLLVYVGDQLGLWSTLEERGRVTTSELAAATGTHERMVREWLSAQAASGYVSYNAEDDTFGLPIEHGLALGRDDVPTAVTGFFQVVVAAYRDVDKIIDAMRTGKGLGWGDHHPELFGGVERFFRPKYQGYLTTEWIPALDGTHERLRHGGRVADVGCGHGASTLIMAAAYPNAEFVGFDTHGPSIEQARRRASEQGLGDRVTFDVASAQDFPGSDYDLVAFFDALHDMGDPLAAARHTRKVLRTDGSVLLVEPFAQDRLEANLNPVGRVFYSGSTVFCTPASLNEDGAALGAQAGEARLRSVFEQAEFVTFRRVAETPFNLILEARP
jgi:SAM-dependent methyltransferase